MSLVSGIAAGLAGAVASQPADVLLSRLASGAAADWRGALDDVLRQGGAATPLDRAKNLWTGMPQRCVALAVVVTAQFLLFDSMRALLAVSPKDLSVFLDVFTDRVSFYDGWDEIAQDWAEAVSEIGDLVG